LKNVTRRQQLKFKNHGKKEKVIKKWIIIGFIGNNHYHRGTGHSKKEKVKKPSGCR